MKPNYRIDPERTARIMATAEPATLKTIKCKTCTLKSTSWGEYKEQCDHCGSDNVKQLSVKVGEPP